MGRFLCVLVPAFVLVVQAQDQTASRPAFEVADIKPADPANPMRKGRILPGGRIEVPGATVNDLILMAYGVQENMLSGSPKWAGSERFDIVAKAGTDTSTATIRLMVQSLLADRFQLTFHREDKVMSSYVLTVGKRELKLKQAAGAETGCSWVNLDDGRRRRECHGMPMAELARQLPGWGGIGVDLPVVDETGLKGPYDFELVVGMQGSNERERKIAREGGPAAALADSGPTIFAALEQVGLKLESRKMPLPMIVVDRVEKPSGN